MRYFADFTICGNFCTYRYFCIRPNLISKHENIKQTIFYKFKGMRELSTVNDTGPQSFIKHLLLLVGLNVLETFCTSNQCPNLYTYNFKLPTEGVIL